MLTQQRLKQVLHYNPDTGLFTRLTNIPQAKIKVGDIAGFVIENYRRIKIDGVTYKAHRLVWLYIHGKWPDDVIDHINGLGDDNRLSNLRAATKRQNSQNRRLPNKSSSTGFLGVAFNKRLGKYTSAIRIDGKDIFLGVHATPELAYGAYLNAKRKYHEFCTL